MDIAVDVGQSSTRIALASGGRVLRRLIVGPMSYESSPVEHLDEILRLAAAELVPHARDHGSVTIGLTTLIRHDEMSELAAKTERLFAARRTVIVPDMITAHLGALGGLPGVVVAAGTGAVVLAIGEAGSWAVVDGDGYLLGDDGGGYWIGRRGLRAALAHEDGRTANSGLAAAMRSTFGTREALLHAVYREPGYVQRIASFSRQVGELAEGGDRVASGILDDAAGRLVLAAEAAARRVQSGQERAPVAFVGGATESLYLARRISLLVERSALLRLVEPAADCLEGAVLLGNVAQSNGIHTAVIESEGFVR